ncbi:MAG: hypothetical protein WDA21_00910 [Bacilli bacterium]
MIKAIEPGCKSNFYFNSNKDNRQEYYSTKKQGDIFQETKKRNNDEKAKVKKREEGNIGHIDIRI